MKSKYEFDLIVKIAERAADMFAAHGITEDKMNIIMDIESVNEQIGLRLDQLLGADDLDFAHDIGGIRQHIDRSTYPGKLTGCFLPRFALL